MLVLCLATVLVISTCNVAGQSCYYTYTLSDNSAIVGGVETSVRGLEACKAYCTSTEPCRGFDFDPITTGCSWLNTQEGLQPKEGIQHYDKICQVVRDLVSTSGYLLRDTCFNTNYKGPVYDFWAAGEGINWNFQIAHFGFDWPQSGILSLPLSSLVFIDSISFKSSDNLDYFRVVITRNNGNTITTQAIGPNDKSISLSGASDVKKVDFYLAPVDFRRNVSLNDIKLKACTGISLLKDCTIVNLIKDLIQTASLGIIRLGGTSGTFSASVAPEYPFIELDLNCVGFGTIGFTDVIFRGSQHFQFVMINVWDGDTVVPIPEGDTFSDAQDIKFTSIVRGDRIRSTIIPSGLPDQGINGSIGFSLYQIFVG